MNDLGEFSAEEIAEMDYLDGSAVNCDLCDKPERRYNEHQTCLNCDLTLCRGC